jgi:tRNA modification GTPase
LGKPNTGKSSLLNLLLGYERAIVTEIPGTTRDTIEEKVVIGDSLLRIVDTAGLRKSNDMIENLSFKRTLDALDKAGIILVILDGSKPLETEDHNILQMLPPDIPSILIVNKSDLPQASDHNTLDKDHIHISALTGNGTDKLEFKIKQLIKEPENQAIKQFITN